MHRREFLQHSITGLGLAPFAACSSAKGSARAPLYEISLAQWSLHRRLRGQAEPALDNLDFAAAARRLDIGAVEYVNTFFQERAGDTAYLTEMRKRADAEGVKNLLIMCDREGRLGDPDEGKRTKAVDNHKRWVEAAAFLGCHSLRVNAASSGSYEEQLARAADGLRRLTEFATDHEINVIVENHGGLSSNGAWLAAVMKKVDHPSCGTLPDFGNFNLGGGVEYDKYKGVEELMPYAKAVSAKSFDFDKAGNETTIDYPRMMKIVVAAGYRGYVGIEYEGRRLPEEDGIVATRVLLERIRDQMSG